MEIAASAGSALSTAVAIGLGIYIYKTSKKSSPSPEISTSPIGTSTSPVGTSTSPSTYPDKINPGTYISGIGSYVINADRVSGSSSIFSTPYTFTITYSPPNIASFGTSISTVPIVFTFNNTTLTMRDNGTVYTLQSPSTGPSPSPSPSPSPIPTPSPSPSPAAVNCVGVWQLGTTCSTNECGRTGYYTDVYKIATPASNGGTQCTIQNDTPKTDRTCTPQPGSCTVTVDYVFNADSNGPMIDKYVFRSNGTFSHFTQFFDTTPAYSGTWLKNGTTGITLKNSSGVIIGSGTFNTTFLGFPSILLPGGYYYCNLGNIVFA